MKQIYIDSYYGKRYSYAMQYILDNIQHPKITEIEHRLEIIQFFDDFGETATRRAFGKSRSTVYLWKQRLSESGGRISSLASKDKTPIHKRRRIVHPFIKDFILNYRLAHPGVDKTTITPALNDACRRKGIQPVSESTVGRIIKDLKDKGSIPKYGKVSFYGQTGNLFLRERKATKRKSRRKDFHPAQPGDLVQMDTVSIFACGIKRYLFTAIDVNTRITFAFAYKANTSANGRDFLNKFVNVTPFATARIQTDNGSEFAHHFDSCCKDNDLVHFYNYPRHPQSNGHIERFNKTIQEQFVYSHIDEIEDPEVFNRSLMEYLIWYNTERPHRSIGKIPPLRYYLDNFISPKKSNMLWTLT